jgi:hypothetical protein
MINQQRVLEWDVTSNANMLELRAAQQQPVVSIAATLLAGREHDRASLDERSEVPVKEEDILFVFTVGAVGANPAIKASWTGKLTFSKARVYIRTADALYRAPDSSLKTIKELLPSSFQQVGKSVLANLNLVMQMQLKGGANRPHNLTYAVKANELTSRGFELVKIGREFIPAVRARFAR